MKQTDINRAGIQLYTDQRVPIDHARYGPKTRARVRRFTALQRAVIASPSAAPGVLAGRHVALDLISVGDLPRALSTRPYARNGDAYVEWLDDQGLDRRQLCFMTVLSLGGVREPGAEIAALRAMAGTFKGYAAIEPERVLDEVELDRIAWASERLQKALWSHAAKVRRFTLLLREDLANDRVDAVPAHQLDTLLAEQQAQMADLVDAGIATGRKLETMPAVVQLASEVFTINSKRPERENLANWTKGLLGLRPHVEAADVASAVIVGWNHFLVNNGTSTATQAALKTRARYARVANSPLWRMVANLPSRLEDWTSERIRSGCKSAMLDPSCQDKQGLGAAISSFRQYLEEEFGIEVSLAGLHNLIQDSKPRAKRIAPTAIQRAVTWVTSADKGDKRLLCIALVMLQLASVKAFRISELRWLRIGNLHFSKGGGVEIEVTPLTGINPLKTDAATRRIRIEEGEVCSVLRKWTTKRVDEGAPDSAYLFGQPDRDDKLYRPHAVHALLLEVLKRATGDVEVTFHSLRHTVITNDVEAILLIHEPGAVNRFALMADEAGHVVAATSFEHYAHRIETPLRFAVDRELKRLGLTNTEGSNVVGVRANTLTQGAYRRNQDLTSHIWTVAEDRAKAIISGLPDVAEGLTWTEPKPPIFTGPVARAFTVNQCLIVLDALAKGKSVSLIEHRHGLSDAQQDLLVKAALDVIADLYRKREKLPPASCKSVKAAFSLLDLDVERLRQPRYRGFVEFVSLPQDPCLLESAARAWTNLWWDGEICADEPAALIPLLQLLQQAGVAAENLLLCKEPDANGPKSFDQYWITTDMASYSVFNQRIPGEPLAVARPGRASAYLLWTSGPGVGPAGRSNSGFDVLMFATAVWAQPSLRDWR